MRILHIWDQAGVAAILAKYQRKLEHETEVIKRFGFDKYGIDKYYESTLFHGSNLSFYLYAIKRSEELDVVHIHSLVKIVPFIRKPKVLHFHGSDLRNHRNSLMNYLACKSADKVLVSTPDLLSVLPKAEWLPNPVDTSLFHPVKPYQNKNDNDVTPYPFMPCTLCSMERYVQHKPWSLTTTSLQALACGIPVFWNGLTLHCSLPIRHKPEVAAERTIQIYQEITEK